MFSRLIEVLTIGLVLFYVFFSFYAMFNLYAREAIDKRPARGWFEKICEYNTYLIFLALVIGFVVHIINYIITGRSGFY